MDRDSETVDLVRDRDDMYGTSWKLTGSIIGHLQREGRLDVISGTSYLFCWIMILNKLIRALASPYEKDHWADIRGYAFLVSRELDKG